MSRIRRHFRQIARTAQAALVLALMVSWFQTPYAQAVNSVPKILNYQARLTDTGGVQVPNGSLSVKFVFYDGGGTCLYSVRGSCGVPTAKSVTVTNGVFSTQLGVTSDGDNEIPDGLFDANTVYLGVTIGTDSEMTPRKRLTSAPYALNADRLDDLDATSSGSTTAYIPSTTANGNLVITGDPQGSGVSNGSFYVNPSAATGNETLFAVADNGSSRFQLDKEGDLSHTGSLLATSASSTSQFIFRGAASPTLNLFEIQDSSQNRLFTVSATSALFSADRAGYAVGIGNAAPANKFTIGSATSTFEVDTSGNLVKVNNVAYSWPASQGSASTILQNNGSGTLTWTAASGLVNLNQAYANSTGTTELYVNSTQGALSIQDQVTGGINKGVGIGNLFEVLDRTNTSGDYSARFFTVSSTSTLLNPATNVIDYKFAIGNAAPANMFTVGSATSTLEINTAGNLVKINNVAYSWPSSQGGATTYLQNDGSGNLSWQAVAGGSTNLLQAFNSSTSSNEIYINSTQGALTVADTFSGTGNIFEVQDRTNSAGDYGVRYLTVSSTSTNLTYNSITTTTGASMTFNGLTSGTGLSVNSTATGLTGSLLLVQTASTSGFSNGGVRFNYTGTHSGVSFQIDDAATSATTMRINANSLTSGSALTISTNGFTASGSALVVTSSSSYTNSTGLVNIVTGATNGTAMRIDANSLTGGTALYVNSTASYTGAQGVFALVSNASTGLVQSVTAGSLTSGTAISVNSTSNAITSGKLLTLTANPSAVTGAFSGSIASISHTPTYTLTNATYSGTVLSVTRNATMTGAGLNPIISGPVALFSDSTTLNAGTVRHGAPVVSILQNYTNATGTALTVTSSATGSGAGYFNALYEPLVVAGNNPSPLSTLFAVQNTTAAGGTGYTNRYLTVSATSTNIAHNTITTTNALSVAANAITTGTVLDVSTTSNDWSSGTILKSSLTSTAQAGNISGTAADFSVSAVYSTAVAGPTITAKALNLSRTITSNGSFVGSVQITGAVLTVSDQATQTTGTINSSANLVEFSQNYASNNGTTLNITTAGSGGVFRANDDGTLTDGTPFFIDATGSVGIGSTSPQNKLDIEGGFQYDIPSSAGQYALCHSTNGATADEDITDCISGPSADYMEMYPAAAGLEMGDVVMPGSMTFSASSGNQVVQVTKTLSSYEGTMLGVISNPADAGDFNSIGYEFDASVHTLPVALKGRVRVKVNMENGPIKVGDPITSSSAPGVGMRSTKPGMIVGQALEAWNGPGQGTVLIFMGNGFHTGLAITTDGTRSLFGDEFTFKSLAIASASGSAFGSYALRFSGSAWDSSSNATIERAISISNDVADAASYQLAFRNDAGDMLANLNQAGDFYIKGSLTVNGGLDYAETFPSSPNLEPGDLAMVDPENATGYGVKKSDKKYENSLLGVISTKPGFLTGRLSAGNQPVALAGRVPAKVNVENGPISAGDPITSSSIAGEGMKATEAGRVIGIALEAWSGSGTGLITIFVNPSWWNGPAAVSGATPGSALSLNDDALLDFKNATVSNVAAIISKNGLWGVTEDGYLLAEKVEAKEITTERLVLRANAGGDRVVGRAKLQAGYDAILVQNPRLTQNSIIMITFEGNPGANWWIAEKHDGSFMLKLAQGAIDETPFTYWVVPIDGLLEAAGDADQEAAVDSVTSTAPNEPAAPTQSGSGTAETASGTGTPETALP